MKNPLLLSEAKLALDRWFAALPDAAYGGGTWSIKLIFVFTNEGVRLRVRAGGNVAAMTPSGARKLRGQP